MRLEILNPQASTIEQTAKVAHRASDLRGKRLAILLMVLAFNLFGDWLRDVLDPKLRQL